MFSHFNFRYATFLTTFLNFQALGSGIFHVRWYKNLDKALGSIWFFFCLEMINSRRDFNLIHSD